MTVDATEHRDDVGDTDGIGVADEVGEFHEVLLVGLRRLWSSPSISALTAQWPLGMQGAMDCRRKMNKAIWEKRTPTQGSIPFGTLCGCAG